MVPRPKNKRGQGRYERTLKRIMASKAAIVSSTGPVSTAILAYLILGERMELAQSVRMALVIGGGNGDIVGYGNKGR